MGVSVSRRSNRNRRPALAKAQSPTITPTATFTGDQVAALLAAGVAPQTGGGFDPLARLDPQVAFGPGLPLIPAAIDPVRRDTGRPEPRFNEYPVSSNLPGVTDRLVPWKVLRDAAAAGGIPRRCIEIRKADISTLDWAITITKAAVSKAEADNPGAARADVEADLRKRLGPEIARCSAFWERPDPGQDEDWIEWISKLLEEHLVLDAIAIYPRLTYGGDLFALEIIAGDTIKVLRDYRGGKPGGGQAAYQQMLWGFPRGEYTADIDEDGNIPGGYAADKLVYKRRNVRAITPYGFSAVEQSLEDLDVWLRRRSWIRAEYTDGAIPAGMLRNTAQNTWTPAQVLEYETALNDAWSGQTLERHRLRILPPGFELEAMPDVAERYKPEYDLFLLKQLANHFSTTIAELNFTDGGGLGSSGYHEGQSDIRERTATMPLYRWIQALVTQLSRRHLKMPAELEFRILGLEQEDEASADSVADSRVGSGRMTYNEDRDRLGLPRYTFPEADMPIIKTGRGVIFLEGASQLAPPGEIVEPPQAPKETSNGDIDDTDQGSGDDVDESVKAELAAFARWSRRNPNPRRPFQAEVLTKATAPHLADDARILLKEDQVVRPKGADRAWPGWQRDESTARKWASRLSRALMDAVDVDRLAEQWLAQQLVKADAATVTWTQADDGSDQDRWAVTAALAFLQSQNLALTSPLSSLRLVWLEGWLIGHVAAEAVLAGRDVDAWGWAEGDPEAGQRLLPAASKTALDAFLASASAWVQGILANRLQTLAQALAAGGRNGESATQLAARLAAVLADKAWAALAALTELVRASNAAARDAYRQAGATQWWWQSEDDDQVCQICLDNENSGPVPDGGSWPDGSDQPPAHPRCRCWLYPDLPQNP